jgi:hypothetical protein
MPRRVGAGLERELLAAGADRDAHRPGERGRGAFDAHGDDARRAFGDLGIGGELERLGMGGADRGGAVPDQSHPASLG